MKRKVHEGGKLETKKKKQKRRGKGKQRKDGLAALKTRTPRPHESALSVGLTGLLSGSYAIGTGTNNKGAIIRYDGPKAQVKLIHDLPLMR
jgi:hypothetical protein